MKSEIKKMIRNGIFFIIILVLTYVVILSKIDVKNIREALKNTNLVFILIAFILATHNITFEAINLKYNFRLLGNKIKFFRCLKYSTIGFFFSSITPAASGGQPMQLYAMKKDNIKLSHAVSALFTAYISYMISAVIMALIGFVLNYEYINEIKFFKYLVYIGLAANITITAIVIIAMFSRKISHKILNLVISLVNKIRPQKAEKVKEKWQHQLDEYHESAKFMLSNKRAIIRTFILSFLQLVSLHSVAYFVFWSLGFHEYSYVQILFLQSVVFISVSAFPLPGTIGVSETGFAIMYKHLFPIEIVETSMILSRMLSFYSLVIITGISLLIITIKRKRKSKEK